MKMLAITLAIFAFLSIAASRPMTCPTPEDLKPCTCLRFAIGLHISCENFNERDELIRSLKVLRDYKIQNVLLHGLNITKVLPGDLFDGLEISQLRVEQSSLQFSQPAFKGLDESLHTLNVAQKSMIKSSEDFSIARLTKLTDLSIKSNSLGRVRDQWLNGKIPNVHSVVLDGDDITLVEDNAFANLSKLKTISMANNRIKQVARSMFPRPAETLIKIDLSGNEIKSLPYDFFFDMPALKEVVFSGNDLQTLPERIWINVWEQLTHVLLVENNLECDDKLNWLKEIRWPYQVEGKCVSPSKLMGKSLREVYNT